MCELFAMSSRTPTTLTYSLAEFSRKGSGQRQNRDGWGIAPARDNDALLIKEPAPAADSVWVRFIAGNPVDTTLAIAHVRHATRGKHTMENTHPFQRVLGTRTQLFAHNRMYEEAGKLVGPKSPGMHIKKCWACAAEKDMNLAGLNMGLQDSQTILVASVPLDDNGWEELKEGTALAVNGGRVIACD